MRIGIDARSILNPEKNPAIGVGHYTYQLIKHLLDIDHKNQYEIFFDHRARQKDIRKFSRPNVKIRYFPWSDYKKYLPGVYSEILGLATLTGKSFDILHATSPDARVPLGYRGKVVCTFQDLGEHKFPKHYSNSQRIKGRFNRERMAARADQVIAVSESTKKDIVDILKIPSKKTVVIKNAVDPRFFQKILISKEEAKRELTEKFKIDRDYLLFVGTLEPSKNITRLIQAFKIFLDNARQKGKKHDYQLVLVGKRGWMAKEYLQIAKDSGVADNIRFLGYVEGEDLKNLFSHAQLFVMPTLHEGFGMTVLEAMAAGVPALISEISPHQEVAADAAAYVNPFGTEEIAKGLGELVENREKKDALITKGQERAKEFSWEQTARDTLKVYENLVK